MWNDNTYPPQPQMGPQLQANPEPGAAPKSKNGLIIVLIASATVLLVSVGAACILLLNQSKSTPEVLPEETSDTKEEPQVQVADDFLYELDQIYPPTVIFNIEQTLAEYFLPLYPDGTLLKFAYKLEGSDDYEWYIEASDGELYPMTIVENGITATIKIGQDFERDFTNPPHNDDD